MNQESIKKAISGFCEKKILVIGDIILDRYTFGEASRISPEAPVPVVKKTSEKFALGGAANVASNLASLGAKVYLCGVVGNDNNKETLFNLLSEQGIEKNGVLVCGSRPTTVKQRVVSWPNHQMLRIDEESASNLSEEEEKTFLRNAASLLPDADFVVFSDYVKGVFSPRLTAELIKNAKSKSKTIFADFKPKNKEFFRGVDFITPNLQEAREISGLEDIEAVGPALVDSFGAHAVVTMGGDGISLFRREDKKRHHVPGKKIRVFDVSGAGDTVIAVVALAAASGLEPEDVVMLANAAGAVVVQKPGTATLTAEELLSALRDEAHIESTAVVSKLWGYEKWLENNDRYCSKLLSLNKGYQCSLHYHKNKDEMFVVTKGHVRLELGGEVMHLREGNFARVPPGTHHRFAGVEDSLILEISTHHDDADSYRIEESRKMRED